MRPRNAIAIICFILAPALLFGQGARFDSNVFTVPGTTPPGAYPPVLAVPGATFAVCGDAACATSAVTYTDLTLVTACPSNAPVTIPGNPVCVAGANAQGGFGFNLAARTTWYRITFPNGATFGPYAITPGGGGGGGIPGGATGSLQYNSGGVFAGFGTFSPITQITQFPGVVDSNLFNCTQTGGAACIQQDMGTFIITGAGNIAAQSLALTNGLTVGVGAYGLSGSGLLNVSSCTGCGGGGGTPSGPGNSVQFANSSATAFSGSANFVFNMGASTLQVGATAGLGVIGTGLFNCTATGTNNCIQQQSGTWSITGAGAFEGQSMALTNGWTAGAGSYGLTAGGALNVASCQGCAVSTYCQAAGTNTITCAGIPPPGAYAAGQSVVILIAVTNTGATTVNINSLGAKAVHLAGMALVGGELVAGNLYTIYYDGTQFNIGSATSNVTSFNTRIGAVTLVKADVTAVDQALAPGDSPTFSALTITNNATALNFTSASTGSAIGYSNNGSPGSFAGIYANGQGSFQWAVLANQGSPPTAVSGDAFIYATSANLFTAFNGGAFLQVTNTIAKGTATLGTGTISSGTCATAVTVSASGVATTDVIGATMNGDPTSITGYTPSSSGSLYIWAFPTSNNVNFRACNNSPNSITPAAVTLNWTVNR